MAKAKPGDKRIGNNFWTLANYTGRPRLYKNVDELKPLVLDWLEKMSTETLDVVTASKNGNYVRKVPIPLTIVRLCAHLGIHKSTWIDYKKKKEFSDFISHVESIIHDQKITYATIGEFKENIVARVTGLAEKREQVGTPMIKVVDMSKGFEEEE